MSHELPSKPLAGEPDHDEARAELIWAAVLSGLTGLGLLVGLTLAWLGAEPLFIYSSYAVAYLAGGVPAARTALTALWRGHLDIDLLMVVAALAAAAVGEPRDGAILLFLFSLAGTLEDYAMGRTKRAVSGLMKLRPDIAHLKRDGEQLDVPVEELELGDIVVVRPGERIPVDGVVVVGQSAVDQAAITGESIPADKAAGDDVFAASVNGFGSLEVRVSKRASESTLARMIELVTEAQSQKAPSQRFSNWFGQRYTIFVLVGTALALGIFFLLGMPGTQAFYKAATLLVVASPCAVVISVPAAILSALAAAARSGVLFKGGAALEDFGNVSALAFDKTGTLTQGKPQVTDLIPLQGDERALLATATRIEANSEHPIARTILAAARKKGIEEEALADVTAWPGMGITGEVAGRTLWAGNRKLAEHLKVPIGAGAKTALDDLEGQGKTLVLVGKDDELLGIIAVADTVRPQAAAALDRLRALGVERIYMLTGDHWGAARYVGERLGLESATVHAELLPEDKVTLVRDLRREHKLAFVGDGVNDAAALATADVGIAMGSAGSDVALETADIALLADDLSKLEPALLLARKANRIVKQNLVFSVSAMAVLVLLTLFGNLPLPLGVVGHEGGTLVVVANGLRLLARPSTSRSRGPGPSPRKAAPAAAD